MKLSSVFLLSTLCMGQVYSSDDDKGCDLLERDINRLISNALTDEDEGRQYLHRAKQATERTVKESLLIHSLQMYYDSNTQLKTGREDLTYYQTVCINREEYTGQKTDREIAYKNQSRHVDEHLKITHRRALEVNDMIQELRGR